MPTADPSPARRRRRPHGERTPRALRMADAAGLTDGAKTLHLNAKVQPALFDAAARRAGTRSPAAVIEAALAALATQDTAQDEPDELGPWLVSQRGVLADLDPEIIEEMLFLK